MWKNKVRLYVLLPASLFLGLLASELSRGIDSEKKTLNESLGPSATTTETKTEWLVGQTAAAVVSHQPFVEQPN